jgi:AcrR family transcriptional regulator
LDVAKQILEEGKKLVEIHGFRKFKMDELAQNLRMSKRTIYQYFNSKNELVSSIIDSIIANDLEEMKEIIQQKDDYVEKLRAVFYLYNIKMLRKKYLNELKTFFPDDWKKFKTFSENRRAYVIRIYNEGVEAEVFIKKFPDISNVPTTIREGHTVDLLIFFLTSIINQAFETELTDYEFDINTMLIYSYELIIKMFLVEK